jgi:hypothetical protein
MIKLHCTKKLSAKLDIDANGFLPQAHRTPVSAANLSEEGLLSGWHANLFTVQRRNCVIAVHDTTRFPVLMTCLKKDDFDNLNYWFEDVFMNTLLKLGATEAHMDTAANAIEPLCIDNQCNRSVQGTMNQMKSDFEYSLQMSDVSIEDISPYRISAWLADRPCTVKGKRDCVWPEKAMLALLDGSKFNRPKRDDNNIESEGDNVVSLDAYRKE